LEVLSCIYIYRSVCGLSLAVHAQNARLTSDDTHTPFIIVYETGCKA
jgi:hypothetical protein